MLCLPVTRPWAVERVVEAFDASDVPKDVILLLDSPGCAGWYFAFRDRGWNVEAHDTGNDVPPAGRLERRYRHLMMRKVTQQLTEGCGLVLYSEDDTLIPSDTWTRLTSFIGPKYMAASGVQRGRHEQRACGTWKWTPEANIYDPFEPEGVCDADAVGHFCLLTYGGYYAGLPIEPRENEPIDCAHTRLMAPIAVDGNVKCGHLLENGDVIHV